MLLDEAPSHTAKGSLRAAEGMTLMWLPKRAPELNPMDTLWGQGKDVVAANKQFATIDDQVDVGTKGQRSSGPSRMLGRGARLPAERSLDDRNEVARGVLAELE